MDRARWMRWGILLVGALGLGAGFAIACTVTYPSVAFRCSPRQPDSCPTTHVCCSDDPTAEGGALPNYQGKGIDGAAPYFSGINNALGVRGMCVDVSDIPTGSGLEEAGAASCPIPCNPTWTEDEITVVCGGGRSCCQTTELEPADCILVDGEWRPASGDDINVTDANGRVRTRWTQGEHATHQDPNGTACLQLGGCQA